MKNDGTYALNIALFRDTTLKQYIPVTSSILHFVFQSNTLQSTLNTSSDTQTLPDITLGQDYDFTQPATTTQASSSASVAFPLQNVTLKPQNKVAITIPTNGQAFTDQQPTLNGTAAPSTTVNITIDATKTSTTADSLGYWKYKPQSALDPGKHTITITAKDGLGVSRNSSAIFYAFADGAQFLEPSVSPITSPSASPTLTSTPTPISPSVTPGVGGPSPSATPTVLPTATPTATPTVAVVPTDTPTPTIQATLPSPTPTSIVKIQKPGSDSVVFGAFIALIPVILGGLLIFLSKGLIK